jgi:PspA-Associated protein
MIIRIMGEGQFDVPDDSADALNVLDARVEAAVESGDDNAFAAAFAELLEQVRSNGASVADDVLVDSDLVLPPSDSTVDEVAALLGDEGLIPG